MIISFLKAFGLQENSLIFHYISLILHEHEKFLQKNPDPKTKMSLEESLGGSEFILQLYFDHPDSKIFD